LLFIPVNLPEKTIGLLAASKSAQSWNKGASALKCFENFDSQSQNIHNWPLSEDSVSEFITWAVLEKELKAATVKSYLSAIGIAHKFKNLDNSACHGFFAKQLLAGAENLEFYKTMTKEAKKAMSLPILKILGHQLATSGLENNEIQKFWCACVVAFFGSFRLGELLCYNENKFNPSETLLWEDVKIRDDSVLINIKIPKNRYSKGEYVDLFEFNGHNCCPVNAIKALRLSKGTNLNLKSPVFCFNDGKLLTPKMLTARMHSLLLPRIGEVAYKLSGHSFRAGLPSVLSNNSQLASDEEIKLWGRWGSPSFKKYTRLHMNKRRAIFVKITSALNK